MGRGSGTWPAKEKERLEAAGVETAAGRASSVSFAKTIWIIAI